jgi:hypothetical protein
VREFRAGKSLYPLLLWALLASAGALVLWHFGLGSPGRAGLFAALLLLGPGAAAAHALRCRTQSVRLVPGVGLVLAGGRTLPWSAIAGVERRPAAFDRDRLPWVLTGTGSGVDEVDDAMAHPLVLFLQLAGLAAWFLLLPALVVLSPWPARVVLRLEDGASVALTDLEDDAEFEKLIRIGIGGGRSAVGRLEEACGIPPW